MTRNELIKHLEEVKRLLVEEIELEELTDFAREKAYYCVDSALQIVKENEED